MPRHVIVDGSNIATEGRKMPSLKQLSDAVTAYMAEFPDDVITVVVDATFGHRIDPSEVSEFDAAVAHNELVAPPAGAIGRGDAFVLSIANKTKGSILSNDSYQEFHGEFPWLFDEGRLIGGKPVPNVGWVFVLRSPVRGPVSRKSVKAGRSVHKVTGQVPRTASKEASQPMPVPKAPPPGATAPRGRQPKADERPAIEPVAGAERGRRGRAAADDAGAGVASSAPTRDEPVNELMAFIDFVEHHPVGSSVNAVVESYSSHGAYVTVGSVRGYVPLRLMSDPPARSARELGKVGDAVTLVVHSFTPARRSIDMAVPAAAVKAGVTPRAEPAAVEAAVIAEVAPAIAESHPAPTKPARRSRRAAASAAPAAGESGTTAQPAGVAAQPASTAESGESGAVNPAAGQSGAASRSGVAAGDSVTPTESGAAASGSGAAAKSGAAARGSGAPAESGAAARGSGAPAESGAAASGSGVPTKPARRSRRAAASAPTPEPALTEPVGQTEPGTSESAAGVPAGPAAAPAPKRTRAKKATPPAKAPAAAAEVPADLVDVAADTPSPRKPRAKKAAAAAAAPTAGVGGAEPEQPAPAKRAPAKQASRRTAAPAEPTAAEPVPVATPEPAPKPAKRAPAKKAPAKKAAAKQASAAAPAAAKAATKKPPAKRAAKQPPPPSAD